MKNNTRKEQLINTAYELFISKGYDSVSVDEIIAKAGIAKGTYYYYFKSKEETLEQVIEQIIQKEEEQANAILPLMIPIPQKIVAIITSYRPDQAEISIAEALNRKENLLMHEKINARIIESATPILTSVVKSGIEQGIFNCDNIEERIKTILILSNNLFDSEDISEKTIIVFIDVIEKILGAQKGTMEFVKQLITKEN